MTNLNIATKLRMLGLEFSSESKLFGEGPLYLRTTSATLHLGEEEDEDVDDGAG